MAFFGINRRSSSSLIFNPINTIIILTLCLTVVVVKGNGNGNKDWLQKCGICHCNWVSGKKAADCKNHSLNMIPQDLSSDLQVIDLANNRIPEIRRDEFYDANLQNLHKIYMRNCTLLEVSRDALKELTILIELDLSNNLIRTLHPGTFADLIKLRNVFINNNEIEVLENNLFKDLKQLLRIELKHNRIKRIEVNTFVKLPVLNVICLEANELTLLRKETFEKLENLKELTLIQNPWNCTCELQPFRDFAVNRHLYTPPTDCREPEHLRGKLWSNIPSEHFACRPRILQPRPGALLDATTENVTLTCRIKGTPRPEVLWIYNKRPINLNDHRFNVRNSVETNRRDYIELLISELTIIGIRSSDKGSYTCVAKNSGGQVEADVQLSVNVNRFVKGAIADSSSNLLLIICIIALVLLTLLIFVILILCWYCRRIKKYTKDSTMSENGLISSKMTDKSQNGSMLEGSVIMEMQKSLLTEVNPVEKPPRRTDIEAVDTDDGHEIKKTLLDETPFGSHDEETNSVALSDTTPRSRQTFVDDGYGTNLPPDLLSFPARVPQSPSLQSSMSNIPDSRLYGKSPLSSPVYQHVVNNQGVYGTAPAAFRTLQHPKNRNLSLPSNRNNSPFLPAPVVYPAVVMKQGYMTIPRKPRVPSWAPSNSTTLSEFQPSTPSITGTTASNDVVEPVYDNLGLRTTAGGNSLLNLTKIGSNQPAVRYTMKDRPLPATPAQTTTTSTAGSSATLPTAASMNGGTSYNGLPSHHNSNSSSGLTTNPGKIYEPIHELANPTMTSDTEPLYGTAKSNHNVTIVPSALAGNSSSIDKLTKVPPRPPPKPKKKISVTSNGQGSTSQLFEDEGEDGTEV